jgi:PAS domain S-box-containing protein
MQSRLLVAVKQFTVVVGSVVASTLLSFALRPYLHGQAHFLPFTLAVIASAWYGGFVPGLSATVVGFLVADYFFSEPVYQIFPLSREDYALLGLFLAVGLSISLLQRALARSNAALRANIERLDAVMQRSELAAEQAKIGFHEYRARDQKQIWTPEMERLFGLAPESFEGSYAAWIRRIHPADRDRVVEDRSRAIEGRLSAWKDEYRALFPDGKVRWMESRSRLFYSQSGSLKRILGATIDVTERRELEESLLRQSQQLAESNQELERFAYAVSHDLQEPLRGITAMTELYLTRAEGTLDRDSARMLNFVLSSAGRMKSLIQDILELARASGDSAEPSADVNTGAVLEIVIQDLREAVVESGARVLFDSLPVVRGNEAQLLRLFENLVGNAIKYRGKDAPEIRVSATESGRDWVFCVSDNGIGIDPLHHSHVFDVFWRVHGSALSGTGLGLSICKRIVQRHGGRIWVESEPGKGSRFYFTVPKNAMETSSARDSAVPRKPSQGAMREDDQSHAAAR